MNDKEAFETLIRDFKIYTKDMDPIDVENTILNLFFGWSRQEILDYRNKELEKERK